MEDSVTMETKQLDWPPKGIDWFYSDASTAIVCADCRDVLPKLGKVDLVLTDPPFSEYTHANAKSNRNLGYGNKAIDFKAIDFKEIGQILYLLGTICNRWVISFMDWRHIAKFEEQCPATLEFVRFGVWLKSNPMPQISADRPANGWDGIAYFHSRNLSTGKIKKRWNGGGEHGNWYGPLVTDGKHPTAKPLPLVSHIVENFSDSSDIILDPFMGSGTTLRAAKDLGRKAIGIELNETYCRIAADRLAQEVLPLTEAKTVEQMEVFKQ